MSCGSSIGSSAGFGKVSWFAPIRLLFGLALATSMIAQPFQDSCEAQLREERAHELTRDSPRLLGPMAISDDAGTLIVSISDGPLSQLMAFAISSGKVLWGKTLVSPVRALAVNMEAEEVAAGFQKKSCEQLTLLKF